MKTGLKGHGNPIHSKPCQIRTESSGSQDTSKNTEHLTWGNFSQ